MNRLTLLSAITLCLSSTGFTANAQTSCTAVPFAPGVISTTQYNEGRISFAPGRNTIYWNVNLVPGPPGSAVDFTIMTADRTAGGWSEPRIASFSGLGSFADSDPFVTPDGRSLIFSSNRPGNLGQYPLNDLWVVHRQADGSWGQPVNLGGNVNSPSNELYASADLSGNLYFASDREQGHWDIYRSRRRANGSYAPAEKLNRALNHPGRWEFNPEISPDGRTLLLGSFGSHDTIGKNADIWVSRLEGGMWGTPINLGTCVNSTAPEFNPTVLWDRGELYFVRVGETLDFMVAPLQLPPE